MEWSIVLRCVLAFAVVALLVPATAPLALRFGLCDRPGGRKQHETPTSYVGGLCILFSVALGYLLFEGQGNHMFAVFLGCASMLAAVGFVDDWKGLSSRIRFGAQATAAILMILAGVYVSDLGDVFGMASLPLGWVAIPFTVFIVVGVVNALNMIDGSDGVAGGQVLVSLFLFSGLAFDDGNMYMFVRLLSVMAAVAGFMVWNLRFPWQPRALVFLGNAGSMVLGFVIAWVAVRMTQSGSHPVSAVLAPWTIAIPLMDCVTLMIRRISQGRSPFAADRNHLHHLLLDAGFNPTAIAWGLMAASLAMGMGAIVAFKLGFYPPMLVIVFLALLVLHYVFTSNRERAVRMFSRLRPQSWAAQPVALQTVPVRGETAQQIQA